MVLHEIGIPLIVPSRWQPRETFEEEGLLELAQHIRDHGLMYPIIVFQNEDGEYELIAGERRTRAMTALALVEVAAWVAEHGSGLREAIRYVATEGWKKLDVGVQRDMMNPGAGGSRHARITARIEENGDHARLHELAVADNIQRENLSPLEEARALQDLMTELGLSQREMAKRIGWSQSKLQERLALLGVVDEVKKALTAHAVSVSHLRHIARVPEELQGAVTRHVVEMVQREGDQSATVRQVANLAREVREFVQPERWTPQGAIEPPAVRNRYRLIRHLVEGLDLSNGEVGERLLGLRSTGWDKQNVLAKRAETVARSESLVRLVTDALTGEDLPVWRQWREAATGQGWTCDRCRLCGLERPATHPFGWVCERERAGALGEDELEVITCLQWQGAGEELMLPVVSQELAGWVEKLGLAGLKRSPFAHFTDYGLYVAAVNGATVARARQIQEVEEERNQAHLGPIRAYWEAQQPGGALAEEMGFQAHRCERCTSFRQGLPGGLPPCEYAVQPLTNRYDDRPRAPEMGVLVSENGRMVPRCEGFRMTWVLLAAKLARSEGFRMPDRGAVVAWMHQVATGRTNSTTHGYTLPGPLSWLPYERGERDQVHDVERMERWVREHWDELGDEGVAALLTVLASEVRAGNWMGMPFTLVNPGTGAEERWAGVSWRSWSQGKDLESWGRGGWPEGWPKPWIRDDARADAG